MRSLAARATPLTGLLLLTLSLVGCDRQLQPTPTVAEPHSVTDINAWFDARHEEELQFSPIQLTFLGRKERHDELDSLTYDAFATQLAWKRQTVEEMQTIFDYASLAPQEQISYDLWIYQYEQMEESKRFFYDSLPFSQMGGLQSFIPTFLINFHKVEDTQDLKAYITRVKAVAPRMREALANVERSASRGVMPPLFALNGVIQQSQAVITGAPFNALASIDSDIWADIRKKTASLVAQNLLSASQAEALLDDAKQALISNLKPAYEQIIAWAEAQKDRTSTVSTGIGTQPNGAAYYKHRLATQTTTDLTADEIHQIGLREIKRIRLAMHETMAELNFDGDLATFFNHVRDGKWNYFPDTQAGRDAYISEATAAIANIKTRLPDFFGLSPETDLIIKRVEAFRERDGAAQHYYPGTPDGSRPGIYYVHLSDMAAVPKNQLEVIAYHEGLPGHHMQIAIAQALDNLPKFRTQANFTAYSEGWALYSEVLAREIPGTFLDPYSRFGQQTSEIWRAIRLVVDTGLHAKGWTAQEAINFFMQNSPEPLESVTSEIHRYIVMPAQATSYKIGMLKIQQLRNRAEQTLGKTFDIRSFHDVILGAGALPLPILERVVEQWIADSQNAT